ncbi:MAG: hypothetical protein V2I33_04545, partial [Kangiellaceae bacterium]|nr:hypothetical protein [Kangiellaceae bacterium]
MTQSKVLPEPIKLEPISWQRELAKAISDSEQLLDKLGLKGKVSDHKQAEKLFKLKVTESYVSRMEYGNTEDPLFRQIWPSDSEYIDADGFVEDPLAEQASN